MLRSFGPGFAVCTMICTGPWALLTVLILQTGPCLSAHLSDALRTSIPVRSTRSSSVRLTFFWYLFTLVGYGFMLQTLPLRDASCLNPAGKCFAFFFSGARIPGLASSSRPATNPAFESAADAFGEGSACGAGGWLRVGSSLFLVVRTLHVRRLSLLWHPSQGRCKYLDIASYETLAQGFLLILLLRTKGGGRLRVKLPALSDNVGAESVINRLYTANSLLLCSSSGWPCGPARTLCHLLALIFLVRETLRRTP